MANKKLVLLAVTLFATLGLAGCDEIVAKPTNYNDPVILDNNDKGLDIYNNDLSKVFDSIRDGALAGDVLDELLYQYANSAFGQYNHVLAAANAYTLKDAARAIYNACSGNVDSLNADSLKGTDANKFVKEHKAYWTVNDEGARIHYTSAGVAEEVKDDADADKLEYARVLAKWNTIEDRIAKTLYGAISGATYSERNVFHEVEYLYSLYGNMNYVANPKTANKVYSGLLWPDVEDVEVFTKTVKDINGVEDTILHRDNYQAHYALADNGETSKNGITYVEDELIPDIYRTLLVEQYLLDESYPTLGRSYARKVNVIKISGHGTYTKGASYLMDSFIKNTIFNAQGKAVTLDDFKTLSNAWTGAFMADATYATTDEYKIWDKTGIAADYVKTAKDGSKYLLGTAYGDMMESYDKISDNPAISQNESDFTGASTYSKEIGKEIKTREIEVKDNTTTGWYIKNGGLSDLPDSIRSRLFSISVANAVNCSAAQKASTERFSDGKYDATKDFNNYVARINGKCYLKVASKIATADAQDDILFVDGSDYYIVQVEEAISSSKLSRTQEQSYLKQEGYGADAMEEIINEVVKIVADSEAYRTLSKKHWLEKALVKYHDDVIYDYFKANFPELFEDD